jgi:hypothetical protein
MRLNLYSGAKPIGSSAVFTIAWVCLVDISFGHRCDRQNATMTNARDYADYVDFHVGLTQFFVTHDPLSVDNSAKFS